MATLLLFAHRFGCSTKSAKGWLWAVCGIALCLPGVIWLWGYSVDDALIIAQMAAHLSQGVGYRFNPSGPIVDAVTPLGYAHLLAMTRLREPLEILDAARWLGLSAWLAAAGLLALQINRLGGSLLRYVPLLALVPCLPTAAWSVSGMETGLVTLLSTLALNFRTSGAVAAGVAAGARPELLPWCLLLVIGRALGTRLIDSSRERAWRVALAAALALAPTLVVASLRVVVFGSPTPLSVLAKPSDLAHGLHYATSGLFFLGIPVLLLVPSALRRPTRKERVVLLAILAHFAALVLAGGDWMALYRLWVPVVPSMIWLAASLQRRSSLLPTLLRVALAATLSGWLFLSWAPAARQVMQHRRALIEAATPLLRNRNVATLDVGWVAAAKASQVIDLAGVTDRRVAVLAGGHTSKRVGRGFLMNQSTDTLVLLLAEDQRPAEPWHKSPFARGVEHRVARAYQDSGARVIAELPLGGTRQRYVVVYLDDRSQS